MVTPSVLFVCLFSEQLVRLIASGEEEPKTSLKSTKDIYYILILIEPLIPYRNIHIFTETIDTQAICFLRQSGIVKNLQNSLALGCTTNAEAIQGPSPITASHTSLTRQDEII